MDEYKESPELRELYRNLLIEVKKLKMRELFEEPSTFEDDREE